MPNWANTPPVRKFVDKLPQLGPSANGLVTQAASCGQYLSIANPDKLTYPGSDYYELELRQYSEKMHSDLPPTKLQGYVQVNNGTDPASGTDPWEHRGAGADPLSGTEHRRDEGPARPHQIHQQASHRHGRRPLYPGGPQRHGSGHGPLHGHAHDGGSSRSGGNHGRDHDDGAPQPAGG